MILQWPLLFVITMSISFEDVEASIMGRMGFYGSGTKSSIASVAPPLAPPVVAGSLAQASPVAALSSVETKNTGMFSGMADRFSQKAAQFSGRTKEGLALLGINNHVKQLHDEIKTIRQQIDVENDRLNFVRTKLGEPQQLPLIEKLNSALAQMQSFYASANTFLTQQHAKYTVLTLDRSKNKLYEEQQQGKRELAAIKPIIDQVASQLATEKSKYNTTLAANRVDLDLYKSPANIKDWASEKIRITQKIAELKSQKMEKKAALSRDLGYKDGTSTKDPYESWRKRILAQFAALKAKLIEWNTKSNPIGAIGDLIRQTLSALDMLWSESAIEQSELIQENAAVAKAIRDASPLESSNIPVGSPALQRSAIEEQLQSASAEYYAVTKRVVDMGIVLTDATERSSQFDGADLSEELKNVALNINTVNETLQNMIKKKPEVGINPDFSIANQEIKQAKRIFFELTGVLPKVLGVNYVAPHLGGSATAPELTNALINEKAQKREKVWALRAQLDSLNAAEGRPMYLVERERQMNSSITTAKVKLESFMTTEVDPVVKAEAKVAVDEIYALGSLIEGQQIKAQTNVVAENAADQAAMAADQVAIAADQAAVATEDRALETPPLLNTTISNFEPAILPALPSQVSVPETLALPVIQEKAREIKLKDLPQIDPETVAKKLPTLPLIRRPANSTGSIKLQIDQALGNIAVLQARIDEAYEALGEQSAMVARVTEAAEMAEEARNKLEILGQTVPSSTSTTLTDRLSRLSQAVQVLRAYADTMKQQAALNPKAPSKPLGPLEREQMLKRLENDNIELKTAVHNLHCYESKLLELSGAPASNPTNQDDAARCIRETVDYTKSLLSELTTESQRVEVEKARQRLRDAHMRVRLVDSSLIPSEGDIRRNLALLRGTVAYRKGQLMAALPMSTDNSEFAKETEIASLYERALKEIDTAASIGNGGLLSNCKSPTEYDAIHDLLAESMRGYEDLFIPPISYNRGQSQSDTSLALNPLDAVKVQMQLEDSRNRLNAELSKWPLHETPETQMRILLTKIGEAKARLTVMVTSNGIKSDSTQAAIKHMEQIESSLRGLPGKAREDQVIKPALLEIDPTNFDNPPPSTPANFETQKANLVSMEREFEDLKQRQCMGSTSCDKCDPKTEPVVKGLRDVKGTLETALKSMTPGTESYNATKTRLVDTESILSKMAPTESVLAVSPEELSQKLKNIQKEKALVEKMATDLGINPETATQSPGDAENQREAANLLQKLKSDVLTMPPEIQASLSGVISKAASNLPNPAISLGGSNPFAGPVPGTEQVNPSPIQNLTMSPAIPGVPGEPQALLGNNLSNPHDIAVANKLIEDARLHQNGPVSPAQINSWDGVIAELRARPSSQAVISAINEAEARKSANLSKLPVRLTLPPLTMSH